MKTVNEWVELRKSGQAYAAVKSALGACFSEEEYVRRIQDDAREPLVEREKEARRLLESGQVITFEGILCRAINDEECDQWLKGQ